MAEGPISRDGTPRGGLSVLLVGREEGPMAQAREALRALAEPRLVLAQAPPAGDEALSAQADVAMVIFGENEEEGLNYLLTESEREPCLRCCKGSRRR